MSADITHTLRLRQLAADYAAAVTAVRAMGLDPGTIPHFKPPKA